MSQDKDTFKCNRIRFYRMVERNVIGGDLNVSESTYVILA